MNEDYVSYELALKLKACGFDEPCDSYYDKACAADDEYWHTKREELINWNGLDSDCQISAPTLWHAQKWLRSKGIDIEPHMELVGAKRKYRLVLLPLGHEVSYGKLHPSYEEALEAGIEAALIIIEIDNKKHNN